MQDSARSRRAVRLDFRHLPLPLNRLAVAEVVVSHHLVVDVDLAGSRREVGAEDVDYRGVDSSDCSGGTK